MNKKLLEDVKKRLKPFADKNKGDGTQSYIGKINLAIINKNYLEAKILSENWLNTAKEHDIYEQNKDFCSILEDIIKFENSIKNK